ncbi:MAG: rhodanese-like domain-containing protein [Saprospiraceae bacterium]|nr:rhodanese-like domain-containing protein [Saprospiraceae bacterium]
MSWNSFLKNLLGAAQNEDVLEQETPPGESGPRNENLSGRAFKKQLEAAENPVLLDVRTQGEFAAGTLPGALNLDIMSASFTQKVKQLDKGVTYFVFCRSGNRSAQACQIMHKMGYDVRNLSGGIGAFPY